MTLRRLATSMGVCNAKDAPPTSTTRSKLIAASVIVDSVEEITQAGARK